MKKFKKIYIEITNMCNLRCSFCPQDGLKKQEMSIGQFDMILNKINLYTDYLYLHVKGEPLLHSQLKEILETASKYHKKVNITTNGTLLQKQCYVIINSGVVRQVNISLQSLTDFSYLEDILKCSKELCDAGIYVVFRFWVHTKLEEKILVFIEDYFSCPSFMESLYETKNVCVYPNLYINLEDEFEWPSLGHDFISDVGSCYGLRTHVGILVDGTVIPCCLDSKGCIPLGNIFLDDFSTILNNERVISMIQSFQNGVLVEELCQKCSYRKRVGGRDD